jgi:UDP-N-acetylglucosamine 2-epimerase (non-hydrolysing)
MTMPEEINRILTDQISTLLFTTELAAATNLEREGIAPAKIFFAGNVMIDTLRHNLASAVPAATTLNQAGSPSTWHNNFGLLTLHRPANVDDPQVLTRLLTTLTGISQQTPLVFPVHPRTRARITAAGLDPLLTSGNILLLPPQGYLEMLGLMRDARLVLTDSGGIQEETTALGVPCLTLRESTERPITVEQGTNTIVGTDPDVILKAYSDILSSGGKVGRQPQLWDGEAAVRIVAAIAAWCGVSR